MIHTRWSKSLLAASLGLAALLAAACSGGDDDDPTATPTAEPDSPTPTPTLSIRPIDSPVDVAPDGFVLHLDEVSGFGFHYPDVWAEGAIPSGFGARVFIQGPDGSPQIAVYRVIEVENDSDRERMEQTVTAFARQLGEDATVEEVGPTTLDNGDRALRVDIVFPRAGDTHVMRLQLVSSGLRTYVMTLSGPARIWETDSDRLDTLQESFVAFEPAPYGIARQRALTIPWSDPITLDPAMSRESQSHLIVGHLFSGLVRFDEDLKVELDLAADVAVDSTGTVYTFTLRDDIVFHDGRPIEAEDVRYSLERAADPSLRSATASLYLGDIVGVRAKLEGRASTISGVAVLDARTIRLTIDSPKAYFLAKLTYPTGAVVDRETIEPRGMEWWKREVNGSGPFTLHEWEEGEVLVLERFDDYPEPSSLEYAIFPIRQGIPMQLYEAGLTDVAFIGGADIDRALDPANGIEKELRIFPQFNSQFIGFNTKKPPFDDAKVRRAFAMAVDREELVEVVYGNDVTASKGLLPPGLPGYNETLEPIPFDPEAARELLTESSYGGGDFPEVVYTTSGLGNTPPDVQFLVDSWSQHLGIDVQVRQLDPDAYFYQLYEEVDNLFDYGWIADYPDPENFLDVLLHSESHDNNVGGYTNRTYDRLLEQARSESDTTRRMELYHEAERVLLDDAGIIPLYHGPDYVLTKPHVDGFVIGPLGIPLLQNVTIRDR